MMHVYQPAGGNYINRVCCGAKNNKPLCSSSITILHCSLSGKYNKYTTINSLSASLENLFYIIKGFSFSQEKIVYFPLEK
jgi:hypothetical protein